MVNVLIDTNIFIGLEDSKIVPQNLAEMMQLCTKNGVQIFVHELAVEDILQDPDNERKTISLSKLKKFRNLKDINLPANESLVSEYGAIKNRNDRVDVALLHALDYGPIHLTITEDKKLRKRSKDPASHLSGRVLNIAEFIDWLHTTFETKDVKLPLIEEVDAHSIPIADDIFDTLREDYPDFDNWWKTKCVDEMRKCWVVTINGEIAALVVRKDNEHHSEAGTQHPGPKILKISTFKVKPGFRGEKLGELLLKQILWYAQRNNYDVTYLTTYEGQDVLISILAEFGFEHTTTKEDGELFLEKTLTNEKLELDQHNSPFRSAMINYPRFYSGHDVQKYCIPIQPRFHNILFPEFNVLKKNPLPSSQRTPGNTIRKVYLCRTQTKHLDPGSLLAFYRSKSDGYEGSQCITSIGVIEKMSLANNFAELVKLTGKRSVYSTAYLKSLFSGSSRPVKVIDFLLMGHIKNPVHLDRLMKAKILNGAPQSITKLSNKKMEFILTNADFGFKV